MKRNLIRLALPTLLCAAFILGSERKAPAQLGARQTRCSTDPIPAGWVKVDVITSPGTCGNETPGASLDGNVWVLELYTNKSVGSAMSICADQATPPGWQTLGIASSSGQCAAGGSGPGNIKSIVRTD